VIRLTRRPEVWVALATLLLTLPLVRHSHFYGDDYIQIGTLAGVFERFGTPPLDLYGFIDGSPERLERQMEAGPVPWFVHPSMKVRFFRPVSSALLALDQALFGRNVQGYRIQAILWYLLLVLTFGAWVRRIIPSGRAGSVSAGAVLAMIIFAVSDSHWVNVAWTAGRWVLTATTLALLGCLAHVLWRTEGWKPGRYLSIAAFALSLLAGEVALAVMAFLAAFEIIRPAGEFPERWRTLAPPAVLAAAYLVLYGLFGFGAAKQSIYISPLSAPVEYLGQLPGRMLAMFGEIFLWVPASLWIVDTLRLRSVLYGAGGLLFAGLLIVPAYRGGSPAERVALGRLSLGTVGSMLPLAAADPGGRNLVVPFIGASALLGMALHHWWRVLRRRGGTVRWLASAVLLGAGIIHLGFAPVSWLTAPAAFRERSHAQAVMFSEMDVVDEEVPDQRTVFLTMHFAACWNGYFYRRFEGLPMPARWWSISVADCEHHYQRTGTDRLELRTAGGEMMATTLEAAVRTPADPIREGETVDLDGLQIRVLETGDYGPTRVELTFDRSLDDPSLNFMAVLDGELRRVEIPAVGEVLHLPSPW
jgi:hypothetical protein